MYLFIGAVLFFFISGCHASHSPTIYLIPPSGLERQEIYDLNNPIYDRDDCLKFIIELKREIIKAGLQVSICPSHSMPNTIRSCDYLIAFEFPITREQIRKIRHATNSGCKTLAIMLEPPLIKSDWYRREYRNIFGSYMVLGDNLVDNKKYFKLYFPQPNLTYNKSKPFSEKKLCTCIISYKKSPVQSANNFYELYSERFKSIMFFEDHAKQDFDVYGTGWPSGYKTYRGTVAHKKDILGNYKFCLCYENSIWNGYITEKIFDALVNGCVPVYWGAPNIHDYIPANCFIDRRQFKDTHALYNYLKTVSAREYSIMQANIQKFLESQQAQRFSIRSFIDQVFTILDLNNT